MKNPHIVVDPATRRCLCGKYNGDVLTCSDIMRLTDNSDYRSAVLRGVLSTLLVDCSEPFYRSSVTDAE